jgi:membrane fusion protein (multidrug efflux system)
MSARTMSARAWSAGLALGAACWALPGAQAAEPAAATAALEQNELRAQLAPRRFTTLGAEIGAKISRVAVTEGGAFRKGQVLVTFDCAVQHAQLQKAQAGLQAAEKTWGANQRLAELNAIGSVELSVSEAEVLRNRAEVSLIETLISKCSISAPFDGKVAEQKLREQQFAQPGQAILDIIDDSVLEVEFLVPSRWLAWIKPGHAMRVQIDETGKSYPAKVRRIGVRVDPVSQSVKLVGAIDGRFPALSAGMSGRIELQVPPGRGN